MYKNNHLKIDPNHIECLGKEETITINYIFYFKFWIITDAPTSKELILLILLDLSAIIILSNPDNRLKY